MKHDVHIYAIVRVKVKDVEAESHSEAMDKALEMADLNDLLRDVPNAQGLETESAEEIDNFLVDEVGDEHFEHSQYWIFNEDETSKEKYRRLHMNDHRKYVRRPYVDLEVPLELDSDVWNFLHELCRRFDITYTGGCRAFYTREEYAVLEGGVPSNTAAVIVHDGGDLSYLLNTNKCDTKEQFARYNAACALAEEHEFWFEHLSCVATAVYRKEKTNG